MSINNFIVIGVMDMKSTILDFIKIDFGYQILPPPA